MHGNVVTWELKLYTPLVSKFCIIPLSGVELVKPWTTTIPSLASPPKKSATTVSV